MILRQWGIALGLWALGSVSTAGVLEKVSAGGTLVIAHRESSIPFSYIDPAAASPSVTRWIFACGWLTRCAGRRARRT